MYGSLCPVLLVPGDLLLCCPRHRLQWWVLVTVRLRLATGPPIDLGGREGAERLSTASFAIALGQGSGKEQREPMEMELLCDREARESMEASGACGHRRSLLHASVLAL